MAAVAFGVLHGLQTIAISVSHYGATNVQITAFIMVMGYELVQSVMFFLVVVLSTYLPLRLVAPLVMNRRIPSRVSLYVVFGTTLGVLFLPIYSGIAYFVLSFLPDEPGYLDRCIDYALSMTIAGALGGYVLWRCARHAAGGGELVADQFS